MADWTVTGSQNLPIHGDTDAPAGAPRAVALVVHGWTGCKDRNITWSISHLLADLGVLSHRFTLSHAGMDEDGDEITQPEAFQRDSNDICVADVHAVAQDVFDGTLPGAGLPLLLVGHSRGGGTVYRCAAEAAAMPWPITPAGLISLSATGTLTRLTEAMRAELETRGYVTKPCARAPGGEVRMGPSWYQHHDTDPGLFEDSVAAVRCPVLICHGLNDDTVPLAHADHIQRLLADRNPHVTPERADIAGADHNFNALGYRPDDTTATNPALAALSVAIGGFLDGVLG